MPSLLDVREAFDLVKKFSEENQDRDAELMLDGDMPDMVDGLLCTAQLGVLGWFMGDVFKETEHQEHSAMFEQTLKRLRERYEVKESNNGKEE